VPRQPSTCRPQKPVLAVVPGAAGGLTPRAVARSRVVPRLRYLLKRNTVC
jgi:hypothetical protein